jgi:ubiquinone/menaquinone biosynthesis C-methylase UbiE
MEGAIARWYAALTKKSEDRHNSLAHRLISEVPPGSSILEVAPGPGYLAIELARSGGFQLTGLDISETFVQIARQNAAEAKVQVNFGRGDASGMPFAENSFNFLVCCAAFKNFTRPLDALREMHRVLKPSGTALIIDLRRDATYRSIKEYIDGMDVGAVNKFITKLTFRFMLLKRAYTKAEFQELIRQTKFAECDIREDLIGFEIRLRKAP